MEYTDKEGNNGPHKEQGHGEQQDRLTQDPGKELPDLSPEPGCHGSKLPKERGHGRSRPFLSRIRLEGKRKDRQCCGQAFL